MVFGYMRHGRDTGWLTIFDTLTLFTPDWYKLYMFWHVHVTYADHSISILMFIYSMQVYISLDPVYTNASFMIGFNTIIVFNIMW